MRYSLFRPAPKERKYHRGTIRGQPSAGQPSDRIDDPNRAVQHAGRDRWCTHHQPRRFIRHSGDERVLRLRIGWSRARARDREEGSLDAVRRRLPLGG